MRSLATLAAFMGLGIATLVIATASASHLQDITVQKAYDKSVLATAGQPAPALMLPPERSVTPDSR